MVFQRIRPRGCFRLKILVCNEKLTSTTSQILNIMLRSTIENSSESFILICYQIPQLQPLKLSINFHTALTLFGRPFYSFTWSGDVKNQTYHKPIETKVWMSCYSHESMLYAKFESGSFSIFGDITLQNFPVEKGKMI